MIVIQGGYYSYDNPGPVEKLLEEDLDISQTEYTMLYGVYSYPNIILPIMGGLFIDLIGIFGTIEVLGSSITYLGASSSSFGVMLAGRFIQG